MKGIEKAEAMVAKAQEELEAVQRRKAEILEKEKLALKNLEEAENQHILQVARHYHFGGKALQQQLDAFSQKNEAPKPYNVPIPTINEERINDDEDENDD